MEGMAGEVRTRDFRIQVLGRTLEHLGVQMYKRRDTAVAELVANSWDAGATRVDVTIPTAAYNPDTSEMVVEDNGSGMKEDDVQEQYLVVGRNRRKAGEPEPEGRPVMGRKGIGKLAGFGIAESMTIDTWTDDETTSLTLDMAKLKLEPGESEEVPLQGEIRSGTPEGATSESGTRLTLRRLKHAGPMDEEVLRRALGRRFSRTVRGSMSIYVNGEEVTEPKFDFEFRDPDKDGEVAEVQLGEKETVRYWYGFTERPIPATVLRGWTILVRGKTAQAPNYFFDVEGTASGQHGTKYLTGVVEADYLDDADDDETDLISTDRQEIDWENPATASLHKWGDEFTREILRARVERRGEETVTYVYDLEGFAERIDKLEKTLQDRVKQYLRLLGAADPDDSKLADLADALIRAFEYRQFHDVVQDIDAASAESPEELAKLLSHLHEWKVLESRAILEIIKGRLEIVDKFATLLNDDAPETAPMEGADNLHDLLAEYPWIINPEWQVLLEEKRLTTILHEWGVEGDSEEKQRVDFLALSGEGRVKLIEIKRGGHPVTLAEIARLDEYRVKLGRSEGKEVDAVLIFGGEFDHEFRRDDIELLVWSEIHKRTRSYYEHYRAVLEGAINDPSFARKASELGRTREIDRTGTTYRGPERRRKGLGPQDAGPPESGERSEPSKADDSAQSRDG